MALDAQTRKTLINFLDNKKILRQTGWKNYMETVSAPEAIVVEVTKDEQVQMLLAKIAELNAGLDTKITVRAAAGHKDQESFNCLPFFRSYQEDHYNESFSFSGNIPADIIIRFGPKFHKITIEGKVSHPTPQSTDNPITLLPRTAVRVSAGVQIAEFADTLRAKKLSLTSSSMLSWATVVGLLSTGGLGTGKDEPSFSGHVIAMEICDMLGVIRRIEVGDPYFETIRAANNGFFGIILHVVLVVAQAFNLEERIINALNLTSLTPQLQVMLESPYFTLMHIPTYTENPVVDNWFVRLWRMSNAKITKHQNPPYYPDASAFSEEVSVKIGATVQKLLLESGLTELIPAYMTLAAAVVGFERGTNTVVLPENQISHYRVAFPKTMRDTSWIFPVEHANAGAILGDVLTNINRLLLEAKARGEFPVTYAIYVRYLKGTNGGISATSTSTETERVFSIDFVTHPDAPGITHFERELMKYFKSVGINPRFHYGKNFPDGVTQYCDFIDRQALIQFNADLLAWHGIRDINDCPFVPPQTRPLLEPLKRQSMAPVTTPARPQERMSPDDAIVALQMLAAEANDWVVDERHQLLKADFLTAINAKVMSTSQRMFTRA